MKTIFLVLLLIPVISFGQWQSDMRLTTDSSASNTSFNNGRCIAANGNFVHVVWTDYRNGLLNSEIYYKHSSDGGITWGMDVRLTNNSGTSWYPAIAVSGQTIHVTWYDERDGNYEVYYKRSIDGGISWGQDFRISNDPAASGRSAIIASGQLVHLVYADFRDGNREIYYKRSTDGGTSWGTDTRLTNNIAESGTPSISVSGSFVHVAWYDDRDGNMEIYYKRSANEGLSWEVDKRLTSNSATSQFSCIYSSGSMVHAVFHDNRSGTYQIFYKRSNDGGTNWETEIPLTNSLIDSKYPSITASGQFVHIVWFTDSFPEIYYKSSTDRGNTWRADTILSNSNGGSEYPTISVSGQIIHVVWQDDRDGNYEIYYKHNPTGNTIGVVNINTEVPEEFSLSQNYPNPFNPITKIRFKISKSSFISIKIYNTLGKLINSLFNDQLLPGTYEALWDASNFSSGVYYYELTTSGFTKTKSMVLIK